MVYDKDPLSEFSVSLKNDPKCTINAPCNKEVYVTVDGASLVLGGITSAGSIYVTLDDKPLRLPHTKSIPSVKMVKLS